MDATTIRSNITPEMRVSMKSFVYWRFTHPLSSLNENALDYYGKDNTNQEIKTQYKRLTVP
jgi:hypothetical protein